MARLKLCGRRTLSGLALIKSIVAILQHTQGTKFFRSELQAQSL